MKSVRKLIICLLNEVCDYWQLDNNNFQKSRDVTIRICVQYVHTGGKESKSYLKVLAKNNVFSFTVAVDNTVFL